MPGIRILRHPINATEVEVHRTFAACAYPPGVEPSEEMVTIQASEDHA